MWATRLPVIRDETIAVAEKPLPPVVGVERAPDLTAPSAFASMTERFAGVFLVRVRVAPRKFRHIAPP